MTTPSTHAIRLYIPMGQDHSCLIAPRVVIDRILKAEQWSALEGADGELSPPDAEPVSSDESGLPT